MTRWTIAARETICGGCGHHVPRAAPVLEIVIGRIGIYHSPRVRYRGECCAGPAPPAIETPIVTAKPAPIEMTRIGLLSFDWHPPERKLVAAGEREPGEEG